MMPQEALATYMPTTLRGIAIRARREQKAKFRNLARLLNETNLKLCFKELRKSAAPGVDKITVSDYAANLDANIADLVRRLRQNQYRAKLVRRKLIPKGKGKTRPLGIPALEDKLLQLAVAKILTAIYEADFLDSSWGYRPGRGAQEVSERVARGIYGLRLNWVVDADLRDFFGSIDHDWMIRMLEERVADRQLLRLVRKWLKAGILEEDGQVINPLTGTPQGGIISPILANVYLHYVLDLWFKHVVNPSVQGRSLIYRYADDFVAAFEYEADAHAFLRALGKRLGKFGLSLSQEKTRLVAFAKDDHEGKNGVFSFLGFLYYWETTRNGKRRMMRKTDPKRRQASEARMREWVKENRHERIGVLFRRLSRKLVGYWNYYGIAGNMPSLKKFWAETCRALYKWLNRRCQLRSMTWERLYQLLAQHRVPEPCIRAKGQWKQCELNI